MKRSIPLLAAAALLGAALSSASSADPGYGPAWFPFAPAWVPAPGSAIDLSWMDAARPISRLSVGADGHLADARGRLRVVGVDLTAIPDEADAALVAARVATMGANMVRIHHSDAPWTLNSLYPDAWNAGSSRDPSPSALAKLDRLVAELAARNVYVDLNLLTGRVFTSADGLPPAIDAIADWKARHAVGFFDAAALAAQKAHARALLARTNPLRGMKWAEDPAVAVVEINNENGLVHAWQAGWLEGIGSFEGGLRARWNAWLATRYPSHAAFVSALGLKHPAGAELLPPLALSDPASAFNLEQHEGARARLSSIEAGGAKGFRVEVLAPGKEGWHAQANVRGLAVSAGKVYTLRFRARADSARSVGVELGMAAEPWENLGFQAPLELGAEWKDFAFVFRPARDYPDARVNLGGMGLLPSGSRVDFAGFSLREGGSFLGPGERLGGPGIEVLRKSRGSYPAAFLAEWIRFLYETEDGYWAEMRRFLREDLGCRSLLIGTIVGTSTPRLMAGFDIVDSHAYWKHPQFPGAPWNMGDYFVENEPLEGDPGAPALTALAARRVVGKPFFVTEYDHPSPSTYAAEAFPLLGAFAAFQDWDGWFAFTLSDDGGKWDTGRIAQFFDPARHPGKLAGFEAGALAFRRADFAPGRAPLVAPLSREAEIAACAAASWGWELADSRAAGLPPALGLARAIGVSVAAGAPSLPAPLPAASLPARSDTGELLFDPAATRFTAASARSWFFTGESGGAALSAPGFRIEPERGWMLLCLQALEGELGGKGRFLLSAAGAAANAAMGLRDYAGGGRGVPARGEKLTTDADFGRAPSMTEGISARLYLGAKPAAVEAWALGPDGARRAKLAVAASGAGSTFAIGSGSRTVWYEILVK